jgi:ABC-type transport system involved in cytochrome bd biosynthesis fused ATPase/permease subunit
MMNKLADLFNHLIEDLVNNDNSIVKMHIPTWAWVIVATLIIGSLAIFVFNVPLNTVVTYGFFILMMGSHFFMHGSHGSHTGARSEGHDNHPNQTGSQNNGDPNQNNNKNSQSGGCH